MAWVVVVESLWIALLACIVIHLKCQRKRERLAGHRYKLIRSCQEYVPFDLGAEETTEATTPK